MLYADGVRVRPVSLLGLTAAAVATFVVFCNVYTPDLVSGTAPPGTGTGIGWWSAPVGTCFSAGTPKPSDRPAAASAVNIPPITLALRTMRIGSQDAANNFNLLAWQDLGLDLDGVCTSSPTCPADEPIGSCKPTSAAAATDGNYCRDNTFGKLEVNAANIPEVGGKYGLNDEAFNCALCTGAYNFLIKVSGYNGSPNDDQVRIDFYPSPGLEGTPLPWDCNATTWRNSPCFTADQPWLIRDTAVTTPQGGPDLPDATLADPNAYIRDGYLVANLPKDALFWFPSIKGRKADIATPFPLRFAQGIVTGHLKKAPDGTWSVEDGTIAGRTRGTDVLEGFRLIGFCESDPNYGLMTTFLHTNLDILASGQNDPNITCDAISVGIAYSATQAVAGKLIHVDDLVECPAVTDGGTDADVDSGSDAGVPDVGAPDAPSDAPPD